VIEWFTTVQIAVAVLAGVICLIAGGIGRPPTDITNGLTALVAGLLVAQIVVSIVAPFVGNQPTGDPLEFWVYLISALILPIAAIAWGLVDRSRWSTVVLAVVNLAVAVMVYRMGQIWFVQIA
jgi:urease alpha subunit